MKMKSVASLGLSLLMLSSMALSVGAYNAEKFNDSAPQVSPRYDTISDARGSLSLYGNNASYSGYAKPRYQVPTYVTATLQKQVAYGVWASVASASGYGSTTNGVYVNGSATVERGYYYRVYVSVNAGSEYASCFSSEQYCG